MKQKISHYSGLAFFGLVSLIATISIAVMVVNFQGVLQVLLGTT